MEEERRLIAKMCESSSIPSYQFPSDGAVSVTKINSFESITREERWRLIRVEAAAGVAVGGPLGLLLFGTMVLLSPEADKESFRMSWPLKSAESTVFQEEDKEKYSDTNIARSTICLEVIPSALGKDKG
jgi:hypothetical protein